ncbi:MAG: RND family transporter [Methanomicrobium sp.]|nr:RND family transporter [Methanomicrobium sp.]
MKSPYEYLADIIVKRPRLVAGLLVLMLLVSLFGASLTEMKTGNETYVYKDEPSGSLVLHYSDAFSSKSIILIVEGADVSTPDVIAYLDMLEGAIRNQRYVLGAVSYVDMLKSVNGDVLPTSKGETAELMERLPAGSLSNLLPSNTLAMVNVPLETGLSSDTEVEIVNNIESLVEFSGAPAGITVSVSGSPAFTAGMRDDMSNNMSTLITLAMVLMVVAVMLLFSHVRYTLLPVIVVFCGIIMTFGFMGIVGIGISSIVIAAFPVLIGIGIDYAIQFHSRIDDEARQYPIDVAVKRTIVNYGPAVMLAMIATSLGFIALTILAPAPSVGDFGFICTVGVVWCYLAALLYVPTFAMVINYKPKPPKVKKDGSEGGGIMAKYDALLGGTAAAIAKRSVPVLLFLAMFAVVGIQLDDMVIIDTDEESMVPADMPAMTSMKKITSISGSTNTITVYIKADSIRDPQTLKWMDDFGKYTLNKNNKLRGVTSIATIIKEYNGGILPTTIQEIDEIWAKVPATTLNRYASGQTETVMEFSMDSISIPQTQSLIKDMERDLDWFVQHPGLTADFTGSMSMFSEMIDKISDSKNPMTYFGFLLIFIYLIIVYRNFSAVTPLIPIMMIVGWNGMVMYVLGLTYSLLTATLGAMTIGVASEYTILIMERYLEEKKNGLDLIPAIQIAVQKIGTAITVSGLTTVFGFAALLLATSPMIQNFGAITVVTVVFSLLGAIIVMPASLAVFENLKAHLDAKKQEKLSKRGI